MVLSLCVRVFTPGIKTVSLYSCRLLVGNREFRTQKGKAGREWDVLSAFQMAQATLSHYCSNELITFLHGTWCSSDVEWLGLPHFPWSSLGPNRCARHKLNNFVHTVDTLSVLLGHIKKKKKARNTDFQMLRCKIQWITLSDCISAKPNKKERWFSKMTWLR